MKFDNRGKVCQSIVMRLKAFVLIALVFSFLFVGGVRAEESEVVDTGVVEVVAEEASVPNPESPFFGLQVAWMKVTDNIELWLARTDEKKTELEVKFAEREAVLLERMVEVSETNPELVDKLESQMDKLSDRYEQRIERIDTRIAGFESRGEGMEQKMLEWQEKIQTRREAVEQKRNQVQERIENMGEEGQLKIQDQLRDGSGDGQQVGPGEGSGTGQMQSESINLKGSVQKVGRGR